MVRKRLGKSVYITKRVIGARKRKALYILLYISIKYISIFYYMVKYVPIASGIAGYKPYLKRNSTSQVRDIAKLDMGRVVELCRPIFLKSFKR